MINDKSLDEAVGLELSGNQLPNGYNKIYYGDLHVPNPTNAQAKMTNAQAVMNAVNNGK